MNISDARGLRGGGLLSLSNSFDIIIVVEVAEGCLTPFRDFFVSQVFVPYVVTVGVCFSCISPFGLQYAIYCI